MRKTMKRISSFLLSMAMALTLVTPALPTASAAESRAVGTTYYVSTLKGSDSYDGLSATKPWYSLSKINDLDLGPGDRVLLERGSVFENGYLQFDKADQGSAEAPIQIGAYGDTNAAKPLINTNGNGIWYQNYRQRLDNEAHLWKGYVSSCILLYDAEYIEISDIAMTNWGGELDGGTVTGEGKLVPNANVSGSYNWKGKMNRTGVAVVTQDIGTADHIYLQNLDVKNVFGNVYDKHMNNGGIYFTVALPHDESSTGISRYNDILIEGNRVERTSRWGIAAAYTAYWEKFAAMAIPDDICKKYGMTDLVIRNNYVKDTGGDPITAMYAFQPLIEYNVAVGGAREMTSAIYDEESPGRVAAGIWPWKCKTALFQYNECYSLTGPSVGNNDGQAWDADSGDSTIYQYNYSSGNAGGCVMACLGQAYNTVFRYNISYKDGAGTGVLNPCGAPNGKYYNNTFIVAEDAAIMRHNMAGGTPTIENNIFYKLGSAAAGDWYHQTANAKYDNNLYINFSDTPSGDKNAKTADVAKVFATTDFSTAPTAPAATGLVHSWETDFNMFKLAEDSPAINAGKTIDLLNGLGGDHGVTPPTEDFYGNALDTVPDIGAHDTGTPSLALASGVYAVDQAAKTITNVPNATAVEEFLSNVTVDSGVAVRVLDSGSQEVSGGAPMPVGGTVELSWNGQTASYTLKASSDNALKASIYEIRDTTIHVPFTEQNPVSVHEFLTGVTTAATATGKVYDGATEVTAGNIRDGMNFKIAAQDGTEGTEYSIRQKILFNYVSDFVPQQQGNVWYAHELTSNSDYINMTAWSIWNCWGDDAAPYRAVGLDGTSGILCDSMAASRSSKGHSMAFRVPHSGTITVGFIEQPHLRNVQTSGTTRFLITLDGEAIEGKEYIMPNNKDALNIEEFDVVVRKGEFLRFEARNEGSVNNASFRLIPVITYKDESYTDTVAPEAPKALTIRNVTHTGATLAWSAATDDIGVTGYKVYLNGELKTVDPIPGCSYVFTDLTYATAYTAKVTALDAAGNESEAAALDFTTAADTEKPTAPGSVAVKVDSVTPAGATITWTASTDEVSGLAKYVLSYEPGGVSIDVSKDAVEYPLSGLTSSTEYTVRIAAVDNAGNVSDPGTVSFTTAEKVDDEPPATPAGLAVTEGSVTAHGAAITWTANTEEDLEGYKVYDGDTLKGTVLKGTETYTFEGLTDATAYTVSISAYDASGNESPKTAPVTFTTVDDTAPAQPANIEVTPDFESAEVTWDASHDNVGVDHYELTINQKAKAVTETTSTSWSFTELVNDADYTVSIVAVDAAGNRSTPGTVEFHTTKDTENPTPPADVTASEVTASSAVLTWTASTDNWKVGAYEILNGGEALAAFDVEDLTESGGTLSARLTGLTDYTEYSITVVAVDAGGNKSEPSDPAAAFITLDVTAPATPAFNATEVTHVSAVVSWAEPNDNAGVTAYELQLNEEEVISLTETSYTFEGLTPETQYTVKVRAGDEAGNWSEWGDAQFTTSETPDTTAPSVPAGLTATDLTGEGATLTWEASEDDRGVAGYRIYNGTAVAASVSGTTYTLTGLLPDTEYTLTVRAYDAADNESEGAQVTFRTLAVEDTTPPAAPTSASYDALNYNSVVLTWTRPADKDLAGYRLYNDGQSYLDLAVSQVVTVGSSVRYTLSGLTPETAYSITISAYDKAGNESEQTDPALPITTPAAPDGTDTAAPTAPGDVKAENIGRNGAIIVWTASTDDSGAISRYELYDGAAQLAFVSGSTTSCALAGLLPTTSYTISVYAYDGAGNRSEAGTVTFTTTDGTPPPSPSGGGSGGGSGTITTTEKHEDGSTTKTETDKKTGTVTATTKRPDGSVTVVETRKNGVTTITDTRKDGVKTEAVALPDGYVTASVSVPEGVGKTIVSVPAPKAGPGTVAVLVKPDGTEEVIRLSAAKDGEVLFPVSGDAQIKLVNNSKTFSDVPKDSVYKAAVDFVTARELFNGVGGGRFAPRQSVDRGMMVTVLYRVASGEPLTERLTGADKNFEDVPDGAWFADAVSWAVENGVTSGTGRGFDPAAKLDRQQIAVFLYNFAGKPEVEAGADFADSGDVAPWAVDAMNWAVSNGILAGSDDGKLNPGLTTSRAEVAQILWNLVNHLAG